MVMVIRQCSLCGSEIDQDLALYCSQGVCGHNDFVFCCEPCYNVVHPKRILNKDLNFLLAQLDEARETERLQIVHQCWRLVARYFYPMSVLQGPHMAVTPTMAGPIYMRR